MFVKQMQVGHMAVFAYLVGDTVTGDALVIDPADNVEDIIAVAKQNKLRINYIVNTHCHVDHIGGNAEMKRLTNAKIIVHEGDEIMLTSTPVAMLKMFGVKKSPSADILVKDGQIISVGNFELKVIHTPGHSPGQCCFHFKEQDVLFLADYDLTRFGPWYGDRDSSIEETIASVHLLRKIPADTWVTSHDAGIFTSNCRTRGTAPACARAAAPSRHRRPAPGPGGRASAAPGPAA
jgi:glyoxylase-like metal-dependent hydrolase (beta-lactamase superfamily II)